MNMNNYCLIFLREQRGAFAIIFACMLPVMLGLLAFVIESSRFIHDKARLSDTLEQAALALTVEDNSSNKVSKNQVVNWIKAWMPDVSIKTKNIELSRIVETPPSQNTAPVILWRVAAQTQHTPWFSSDFFPSFDAVISLGSNAGAQKNAPVPVKVTPDTDVMFVVDFSSSMRQLFGDHSKVAELKRILLQVTQSLYVSNSRNRVGFVPFNTGVKSLDGRYCTIQWHSDTRIDDLSRLGLSRMDYPPGYYDFGNGIQYYPGGYTTAYDSGDDNVEKIKELINKEVNISHTLATITDPIDSHHTVAIPMAQVGDNFCSSYSPPTSQARTIPLTSDIEQIKVINAMLPEGNTLITSGVLAGVKLLYQNSSAEKKKLLVMISDGDDNQFTDKTRELIKQGLCKAITEKGIKMAFIRIKDRHAGGQQATDWKNCVGTENFYLPDTVHKLEKALQESVLYRPGDPEETGRNIPAR